MSAIEVSTQKQLDAALKNLKPADWIVCTGGTWDSPLIVSGSASVRASGSASVEAFGSASVEAYGSASVEAYGSASVRAYDSASVRAYGSASVEAYDSASVRAYDSASVRAYDSGSVEASGLASVEAYDSASVRASDSASVEAYDSASVRASDSASVRAYDSASVEASKYVAVHSHSRGYGRPKVTGGVLIEVPTLDTAEAWLDYHGIPVKRGVAVLFKAVDDEYLSGYRFAYMPGTKPACDDWDTRRGCGNGLHFCARPWVAKNYFTGATRYVACPVRVSEIVVIDGEKVKAPRIVGPIFECGQDGEPVAEKAAA